MGRFVDSRPALYVFTSKRQRLFQRHRSTLLDQRFENVMAELSGDLRSIAIRNPLRNWERRHVSSSL